jgi:hypothetical protein
MALLVWEVTLYRKTFIDIRILWSIIFGVGLLAALIDLKNYRQTYSYRGLKSFVFAFGTNLCIWGFSTCTLFMATNFYLGEERVSTTTCKIVDRYSMSGSKGDRSRRKPVFTISYDNARKDIHFGPDYFNELNSFQFVEVKTRKGLLGFDVIVESKLLK